MSTNENTATEKQDDASLVFQRGDMCHNAMDTQIYRTLNHQVAGSIPAALTNSFNAGHGQGSGLGRPRGDVCLR